MVQAALTQITNWLNVIAHTTMQMTNHTDGPVIDTLQGNLIIFHHRAHCT
jgi:hypothetical protein